MRKVLNFLEKLAFSKLHPKPCKPPRSATGNAISERVILSGKESLCQSKPVEKSNIDSSNESTELLWQNLKQALSLCVGNQDAKVATPRKDGGTDAEAGSEVLVNVLEAQRFVSDVFAAMNVPKGPAGEMADALIAADYMGQRSMGICRLPILVADLLNLRIEPSNTPKVVIEREGSALVDGKNAPGPVVANFCNDLAMRKARRHGIGYVAARCSNSIGLASWYASHALTHRMIGICMTNGSPILTPSGGTEPLLGTNPIAFAAGRGQEQFLMNLNMSSHRLDLQQKVALDSNGLPIEIGQRLRPFAPEHKSFGMAAMVEILCGVMTGARLGTAFQNHVRLKPNKDTANLGQVFIVIDPKRFGVDFEQRLADFSQLMHKALPQNRKQPPCFPGQRELQHMQTVDEQGGLALSADTLFILQVLSESLDIKPIRPNKK